MRYIIYNTHTWQLGFNPKWSEDFPFVFFTLRGRECSAHSAKPLQINLWFLRVDRPTVLIKSSQTKIVKVFGAPHL